MRTARRHAGAGAGAGAHFGAPGDGMPMGAAPGIGPEAAAPGGRPGPAATAAPRRPPADTGRSAADAWRALVASASAPYRVSGRFAWHFARGKLGLDPVFRQLIGQGLIAPRSRVLDIGCGQGLLAGLLRAAEAEAGRGGWPAGWAPAPVGCRITGIELMPKDTERACAAWHAAVPQRAAGAGTSGRPVTEADFICGDMRETPFPAADVVVVLDVLHYIAVDQQDAVLERVRQALAPGGRLLLRVGDAAAQQRFVLSQWIDRAVFSVRGHRGTPLHGRPLAAWTARLEGLGFAVQAQPMSRGTPFANVLLTARLPTADRVTRRAARDDAGAAAPARKASPAVRPLPA